MRLLITTDTLGGVFTYTLQLLQALGNRVQAAVCTMGKPLTVAQRQALRALPQVTLYESSFKLEWMDKPWLEVEQAGQWLLQISKEFNPDLVHLNQFAFGKLPFQVPVLVVAHSDVYNWFLNVKGHAPTAEWRYYLAAVKEGLQAADFVVAPTAAALEETLNAYGPIKRSAVIYNGIDLWQYGPADKEPMILAVGRLWDEAKNLNTLASLAKKLNWPVYLAGQTHLGWTQFDDSENVYLLGQLDSVQVRRWMSRAAIVVGPSRYEPFGLSLLEGAASAAALVAADLPSLREVWGQGATYIDPNRPDTWAGVINNLIAQPQQRKLMAQQAWLRAWRYSALSMAQDYLRLYKQMSMENKVRVMPSSDFSLSSMTA